MKYRFLFIFSLFAILAKAQHTFSIVAVDSVTGEIGSAGATCGDSIVWPGTPGAKIISEIIPGKGAIHTQSYHLAANQTNARNRMMAGDSPAQIIYWLTMNDVEGDPSVRQYGIVDYNKGHPRSAAYTGTDCLDYKNHLLGKNYSIQGNILIGRQVLDSMESRFKNTKGTLSDKLMAAMQGAKMVGADSRCTSNGTSSLSAFLRVAKPSDSPTKLFLDLNIAGTAPGMEPIDKLQSKYSAWKLTMGITENLKSSSSTLKFFPNPTTGLLNLEMNNSGIDKIEITNQLGQVMLIIEIKVSSILIDLTEFTNSIYFINFYRKGVNISNTKVIKN